MVNKEVFNDLIDDLMDDLINDVDDVNVRGNDVNVRGKGEDEDEDEDKDIVLQRRIGLCIDCVHLQFKKDVFYCPKWKQKIEAKINKCQFFRQKVLKWNGGKDKQNSKVCLEAN